MQLREKLGKLGGPLSRGEQRAGFATQVWKKEKVAFWEDQVWCVLTFCIHQTITLCVFQHKAQV
jgi:hypothetical protein